MPCRQTAKRVIAALLIGRLTRQHRIGTARFVRLQRGRELRIIRIKANGIARARSRRRHTLVAFLHALDARMADNKHALAQHQTLGGAERARIGITPDNGRVATRSGSSDSRHEGG